jgi:hypothetical protein
VSVSERFANPLQAIPSSLGEIRDALRALAPWVEHVNDVLRGIQGFAPDKAGPLRIDWANRSPQISLDLRGLKDALDGLGGGLTVEYDDASSPTVGVDTLRLHLGAFTLYASAGPAGGQVDVGLWGDDTPGLWTTDQNDYAFSPRGIQRISSSPDVNLTGIQAGAADDNKILWNVGVHNITLKAGSGASALGNRILSSSGDVLLPPSGIAWLQYDRTWPAWRVISVHDAGYSITVGYDNNISLVPRVQNLEFDHLNFVVAADPGHNGAIISAYLPYRDIPYGSNTNLETYGPHLVFDTTYVTVVIGGGGGAPIAPAPLGTGSAGPGLQIQAAEPVLNLIGQYAAGISQYCAIITFTCGGQGIGQIQANAMAGGGNIALNIFANQNVIISGTNAAAAGPGGSGMNGVFTVGCDASGQPYVLAGSSGNTPRCYYAINDAAGLPLAGKWGTLGDGSTVSGGIITFIGGAALTSKYWLGHRLH